MYFSFKVLLLVVLFQYCILENGLVNGSKAPKKVVRGRLKASANYMWLYFQPIRQYNVKYYRITLFAGLENPSPKEIVHLRSSPSTLQTAFKKPFISGQTYSVQILPMFFYSRGEITTFTATLKPVAVSGLVATKTSRSITAEFPPVTSGFLDGYKVWVWSTNKKNPIQTINIEARELEEGESGYQVIFDENLIPGKHYFISVVSVSNGRSSRAHTVRTKLSMPARPKSLRVFAPTKVDHDLEIILEKPKDEVDGFDITVAPEFEGFGGKTINVDGIFEEGSNFKSVFVSDLIPAVSYDVSVRSYVGSVFSKSMTQRGTVDIEKLLVD